MAEMGNMAAYRVLPWVPLYYPGYTSLHPPAVDVMYEARCGAAREASRPLDPSSTLWSRDVSRGLQGPSNVSGVLIMAPEY